MYIGPWQEYRLAKIQDDAVQRLRGEWEAHVRAQLPDGDELRAHAAADGKAAGTLARQVGKDSAGVKPALESDVGRRKPTFFSALVVRVVVVELDTGKTGIDGQSQLSRQSSGKRSKPVPKKKTKTRAASGPGAALAEVEKRKKMFATWLQAHREDASTAAATDGETRLPPLYPDNPAQRPSELISPRAGRSAVSEPFLPPIDSRIANDADSGAVVESDDSFDEDEVNQLLSWTDNLLSPEALDTSMEGLNLDGD
ncbi:hypothetical protein ATCC90586_004119 [Pythium insidiosum]|nr:hypothetical protein ATCC90586_004119 [Pythium insidiosum]